MKFGSKLCLRNHVYSETVWICCYHVAADIKGGIENVNPNVPVLKCKLWLQCSASCRNTHQTAS